MDQDTFKRKLTTVFSADAVGYSKLMGENEAATVKMVPNQPSINGTKAIGELKRKRAQMREYLTMDITIEDAQGAGDFGFAHGTYAASFKPKDGGAIGSGGGKFLTIFKKQANGSWKIYRDSVSPNAPPQ
jgi:ketosteroid isomerase-like protein